MKASGWFGGFVSKRFESRFCASVVKEDVVQVMQEGQTIKHEMYGLGIVTASTRNAPLSILTITAPNFSSPAS